MNFGYSQNPFDEKNPFRLSDSTFEIGQIYTSYDMRFELGRYELIAYSYPYLDSIAVFLNNNKSLTLEISQHSDSRGSKARSTRPTPRRAKNVLEYLVNKGVDAERLRSKGYGENVPNVVYHVRDTFLAEKPKETEPFEKIVLTESYINQFRDTDKRTFERLHQFNRRTEFKIVGFNGVVEMDNAYFSLSSENLFVGQVFEGGIEFRYATCKSLFEETDDFLFEERPGIFDSLISLIKEYPQFIFEIQSHTDSRGSEASNLNLTERRAIEMGKYFLEKGVSNHQLRWTGLGEKVPLVCYIQNDKYTRWKPENDLPAKKVILTERYINQFKLADKARFEMLHQMNRRTDIVIVGVRMN